jgi:hypothetical protein
MISHFSTFLYLWFLVIVAVVHRQEVVNQVTIRLLNKHGECQLAQNPPEISMIIYAKINQK